MLAGRVGDDLAGRDPPLLEVLPEGVVLLVQADHLAVPAPAVAAQVDLAVHRDEVALEDVGLVVDLAVGVLAEAVAADGQHHPQRRIRAEGEGHGPILVVALRPAMHRPSRPTQTTAATPVRAEDGQDAGTPPVDAREHAEGDDRGHDDAHAYSARTPPCDPEPNVARATIPAITAEPP